MSRKAIPSKTEIQCDICGTIFGSPSLRSRDIVVLTIDKYFTDIGMRTEKKLDVCGDCMIKIEDMIESLQSNGS